MANKLLMLYSSGISLFPELSTSTHSPSTDDNQEMRLKDRIKANRLFDERAFMQSF